MTEFAVVHREDIGEMRGGGCPWHPVRHHFGITSFGINAWTGSRGLRSDPQRAR